MTFISSGYTISIPEPVLPGDLEQLAQIRVPGNKVLCVYWMRSTRQAICNYEDEWYVQSDQNIITGIASAIKYEKSVDQLAVEDLTIFETANRGYSADDDMVHDFRDCEWSDYACDRIAFRCTIRETPVVKVIAPPVLNSSCGCNSNECNMLKNWGLY